MMPDDSTVSLASAVRKFADDREWSGFHDPKNLAMALASEAGELLAILRWVANADADDFARAPENAVRIRHELADVGILLLLLCDRIGITLEDAIREKLKLNALKYPIAQSRGRSERPTP